MQPQHKASNSKKITISTSIQDSAATDGAGKAGLVAANLTCYYSQVETDNDVTTVEVTLSDLSTITDVHTDGGIIQVDATNLPGVYRLDLPDGVFAANAWSSIVMLKDSGSNDAAPVIMEFQLEPLVVNVKEVDDDLYFKEILLSNCELYWEILKKYL